MVLPGLRKKTRTVFSPTNSGPPADPPSHVSKVDPVRPPRDFGFGRRLAFTIDEDSVQMAAAYHLGPWVRLLDVTKAYFPGNPSAATTRGDMLRQVVQEYVDRFGGRRPSISLTLTGPQTALRSITVPHLRGHELKTALGFEARRQVPFPTDDCLIDYRVTEAITRGEQRLLRASVLAATTLAVKDLMAPFEELGLTIDQVYHTQDVIGRLLGPLAEEDEDSNFTLIDIHRRSTEISYYRGSNLEFYHVSSLGSSFLANRTDPTVFEYFAESLATEIQNSLDYYGGQFSQSQIQKIFIYGDLSYSDELISLLSDRFGLSFHRFPIAQLDFVNGRNLPFEENITVCLPAVAAAVGHARIANLLPAPLKERRAMRRINGLGTVSLLVLIAMLAGHWTLSMTSLKNARNLLAEHERQAAAFQSSDMFATYNHLKRRLAANQAFLEMTRENPSYLGLNLKELSRLVPEGVRLYDLTFDADSPDRNYLVSGLVTTGTTPPELLLAELVENFVASPFYEDVTIERHLKKRRAGGFELDFSLSMRGII